MEKHINKIKKLLALANDERGNEQERDTALRQAYALMAKHNLDMAEVEGVTAPQEPRINFENDSWSWTWAKQTSQIVARLFFCKYYTGYKINGTKIRHHYVGKESNAMTAAVMADWIVNSILKEGRKGHTGGNTGPQTRSFAIGAMHKLSKRVDEIIAQTQADATPGNALVLASLYLTEAEENEKLLPANLRTGKARQSKVNLDAYYRGQAFGDSINLNKQVGQEPGKITR